MMSRLQVQAFSQAVDDVTCQIVVFNSKNLA